MSRNLVELVLVRCNIESIDPGTFGSLQQLRWLNLSGNKLEKLDRGVFDGPMHLKVLDLTLNQIDSVTRDMFASTGEFSSLFGISNSLKVLYLRQNPIESFESNSFAPLVALKMLHLFDKHRNERYKLLSREEVGLSADCMITTN